MKALPQTKKLCAFDVSRFSFSSIVHPHIRLTYRVKLLDGKHFVYKSIVIPSSVAIIPSWWHFDIATFAIFANGQR